jgi:hypothetical protein
MIEYNPLDILKKRSLRVMPPHFGKIKLEEIKGRYAVVKLSSIENDSKLKSAMFAGFEDHKELTYFMLACPYLRRN